jgi:hypothetical protein
MAVCHPVGRLEVGPSACQCFHLVTVLFLDRLPNLVTRFMIPGELGLSSRMGATCMNDRTRSDGQPQPEPSRRGRWSSAGARPPLPDEFSGEQPTLGRDQPLLSRPTPHLRSPLFDSPAPFPSSPGANERVEAVDLIRAFGPYLVAVAVIGLPFLAVAGGDWLWVVTGITVAAIVMRELAQRATFTFAEGFLAFRNREEWPHGVQEEYDVHYSWPSTAGASPGR